VTRLDAPEIDRSPEQAESGDDPRRPGNSGWIGLAGGATLFAILVASNFDLLRTRIFEDGDFAANSILIDKAFTGPLLHGNYSRVGFYHPGPAILDAQALGQLVFHRLLGVVPMPFNGQFLGILALNAVCVGIAIAIGARLLDSQIGALSLVPIVLLINWWIPYGLASTWMPHTYICPFLLLCVSGAAVASGSWHDLRYLMFAAGVTVHGHVSFVLFAGATVVVALVAAWLESRRADRRGESVGSFPKKEFVWGAVVGGLFAAPIVADVVVHWPGQLKKYVKFTSNKTGFVPRSAADVAHFVRQYWMPTGWGLLPGLVIAVSITIAVTLTLRGPGPRRFAIAALGICALETILVAFYGYRGVDDLSQIYVGYFAVSLPVITLWLGAASIIDTMARRFSRCSVLALPVVALLFVPPVLEGTFANPYRGFSAAGRLSRDMGRGPVQIEFSADGWPSALALIEERRREDRPVCVANPVWSILVTAPLLCRTSSPGQLIAVLGPGDPIPPRSKPLAAAGTTKLVTLAR